MGGEGFMGVCICPGLLKRVHAICTIFVRQLYLNEALKKSE